MGKESSTDLPDRSTKVQGDYGSQTTDPEIIYEPEKDEADPMDYLSQHPLPGFGGENAVVVERIQQEALAYPILQNRGNRITPMGLD